MRKVILLIILTIFALGIEQKQEGVGWLDIFSWDDSSDKQRVLIIGDSIVRQYAGKVRNDLKDSLTITRLSTSKSICSSEYIQQLSIAMTQPYSIILINNGLHDFSSSNEKYEKCYKKAINYLLRVNPKSKIMLVATTNVLGNTIKNNMVISRNKSLKEISQIYDLPYIDLYSIVDGQDKLHKDASHYNEGGVNLLAKKVILEILKKTSTTPTPTPTRFIYLIKDKNQ